MLIPTSLPVFCPKNGEQRRFLLAAASPAHSFFPSGAALVSPPGLVSAKSERSMTGTGAGLPKKS